MENTKKSIVSSAENKMRTTSSRGTRLFLLVLVVVTFSAFNSESIIFGQTREGRQLVTAELITDAVNTEKPFTVGIRFALQPDWYLYWKNPGDAGLPIVVQWELPARWTAGEVYLPIPSKFVHDDITAFGYKNEVVLLATITPAPGSSQATIKARLDWLVCRESCLRGGTSVSLDVTKQSSESRAKSAALINDFRSRLPGTQNESGVLFQRVRLLRNGEQWTLTAKIEGEKADEVRDFYPEIMEGIFMDFKRVAVHQKELTIAFTRQDETIRPPALRGLLVTTSFAYEVEIPIEFSSQ